VTCPILRPDHAVACRRYADARRTRPAGRASAPRPHRLDSPSSPNAQSASSDGGTGFGGGGGGIERGVRSITQVAANRTRSTGAAIQITDALHVGLRFRHASQVPGPRDDARKDRIGVGRVGAEKLQGPGIMARADFAAVAAAIALAPYFAPSSLAVALQDGLESADRPCTANIGNRTRAAERTRNARKVKRDCPL